MKQPEVDSSPILAMPVPVYDNKYDYSLLSLCNRICETIKRVS